MTRTKAIQFLGAAAILVFGGFAGSAAYAHGGHGYHKHRRHHRSHRHHHDHGYHRGHYGHYDDDDDDDYYRRHRRRRHHHDHGRRGYHDDDDYGRWGHFTTDTGVDEVRFNDLGGSLEAVLVLSGVVAPVELTLEATAEVAPSCGPARAIAAIQPARVDLTTEGARAIPPSQDERTEAGVQTRDAGAMAAELGACAEGARFLDARLDVKQNGETLTLLCTFPVASEDGPIVDFECVPL